MKRAIITTLLVLALVAMPMGNVAHGYVSFIVGLIISLVQMVFVDSSGNNDTLHNTDGDLSSQIINEVGDVTKYTVVTDVVITQGIEARDVRVTLHLSDGSTMMEDSYDNTDTRIYSTKHVSFEFDIEALRTGLDNVYADVELWKFHMLYNEMRKVASTTTTTVYFDIGYPYELEAIVSPGTYFVRHNETFTSRLNAKVKTQKNGSASGYNVQNYFPAVALTGVPGNGESDWIQLNLFNSKHKDMPPPMESNCDSLFIDTMLGGSPGSGCTMVFTNLGTPPHVRSQTFDLNPLRVTFKIPKGNFTLDRGSDYTYTKELNAVQMTCNGGEIWEGESNGTFHPYNPDVEGPWAGWQNSTAFVIELNPPDPSTTTFVVRDFNQGGSIIETGVYTLGSPLLTTVSDSPTVDTHTYYILSDSPGKLIMLDESGSIQNLTAGTSTPSGYIDGYITGLMPALYDNTIVAAFSTAGGYDTSPAALGKVSSSAYYLSNLAPGSYQLAIYMVTREDTADPNPPSLPLSPDYADAFVMRTFAIGGIDTPTLVSVPTGGTPVPIALDLGDQVDTFGFTISNYTGGCLIPSIELTSAGRVVLQCEGQYAQIQMYTESTGWETVMGYYEGLPPEWTWTSYYPITDEKMAWFRCKY